LFRSENSRTPSPDDSQEGSLLGPRSSNDEISNVLLKKNLPHRKFANESELLDEVAALLAEGKIVGWFHGRMEFGPRALGARSILADPRSPTMQSTLNLKIKFRESFRPFAPCVLRERAEEIFEIPSDTDSPYMLLVAAVRENFRASISDNERQVMENDPDLRRRVNVVRSAFPGITHVDYSARLQTVDASRHGRFYRLLKRFEEKTQCPLLINTSFNVRGEPIVCTPAEALRCFLT